MDTKQIFVEHPEVVAYLKEEFGKLVLEIDNTKIEDSTVMILFTEYIKNYLINKKGE
jgi:hypothetical protein